MNILDIDLSFFARRTKEDEEPSLIVHVSPGFLCLESICGGVQFGPPLAQTRSLFGLFKEEPKGNYVEVGRGPDRDQLGKDAYTYQETHGPMWLTIIRLGVDGKPAITPPDPSPLRGREYMAEMRKDILEKEY